MRFATSCWLLVALAATTALAQTHPKKKTIRKHALGRRVARKADEQDPKHWDAKELSLPPLMPGLDSPTPEPEVTDSNPVYTYVEQMPTLNGQSGFAVITTAIQQRLMLPSAAPVGRAFVQFVVTKEGAVTKPQIVKGLRADVDSAVVAATRKLPRFEPGKQAGWAVAVSYTLAVPIGAPVGAKPGEASSKK
jgi:hypothetical protein